MFRSFQFGNHNFSSSSAFGKIASIGMGAAGSGASCIINGKVYQGNQSVEITDRGVFVDGKLVGAEDTQGKSIEVKIVVEGDAESVETASGPVTVHGNVRGSVKTMSGGVTCGNVTGSVSTMSGSVRAHGTVGGSVSTMSGSVSHHAEPPRPILPPRVRKLTPAKTAASSSTSSTPSAAPIVNQADTAPRMGVKRKSTAEADTTAKKTRVGK